jgi:hypothetical protein
MIIIIITISNHLGSSVSLNSPPHLPSDSVMAAQPGLMPIVEVAYKKGMWWSLPAGISRAIYESYEMGEDYAYTWDWADGFGGHGTKKTIDLQAMEQKNVNNGRRRSVRVVWIRPEDQTPKWTGEIPEQS